MGFFAKNIYDEDICFCRDFAEVLTRISSYTTNVSCSAVGNRILSERGMQYAMQRYYDVCGDRIHDVYPSNRSKLFSNADALFELVFAFNFGADALGYVMNGLFYVIGRMGLYSSEKEQLIRKYIAKSGYPEYDNHLVNTYLELM